MKTILHLTVIFGLITLAVYSCEHKDLDDYVEGNIVGSFICPKVENGQAADYVRGFCILLEHSGNVDSRYPMDMYAFNLPDILYTLNFPEKILGPGPITDGRNCGPYFFPDSLIRKYKFRFKFRFSNEDEIINFVCGPCYDLFPPFPWSNFKQAIIVEAIKIQLIE